METLHIEMPISGVTIFIGTNGVPDTIIIQTQLPATFPKSEEKPAPGIVLPTEAGYAEEYVKDILKIPPEFVMVVKNA